MTVETPTQDERGAPRKVSEARERRPNAGRVSSGWFQSAATLVATVALIAVLGGVFMLMRHSASTTLTTGGQSSIKFNLPPNSQLSGISMTAPDNGWAVGTVNNQPNGMGGPKNALLVHFDGHAWTTSADSANFPLGQLISVSMDSPTDGWATGSTQTTLDAPIRGLVLHYSRGHWHAVDLSGLGFAGGGQVTMSGVGEGWLIAPVGSKMDTNRKTLVLRYHQSRWSVFSSLTGSDAVSMVSVTDGWAADQIGHAILRYQNGIWKKVATAPGQPLTLTMASPTNGWIGGFDATTQSAYVMQFDGHSWSLVSLPHAEHAEIDQIVASAGDVWIVGQAQTNTMAPVTVAWRYHSGRWTQITLNFNAYPTGVAIFSTTSGWITGNGPANTAALLRYQNGEVTSVYYGK